MVVVMVAVMVEVAMEMAAVGMVGETGEMEVAMVVRMVVRMVVVRMVVVRMYIQMIMLIILQTLSCYLLHDTQKKTCVLMKTSPTEKSRWLLCYWERIISHFSLSTTSGSYAICTLFHIVYLF